MSDMIAATPLQKKTVQDLCTKFRTDSVWVKYEEKPNNNDLRVLLFGHKYIYDFTITVDGYLKKQTSYSNEERLNP